MDRTQKIAFGVVIFLCVTVAAGCRGASRSGSSSDAETTGIIVLNSPANGIVRRVIVGEGVAVREGAPIIEIEIDAPKLAETPTDGDAAGEARARAEAAKNVAAAFEKEVERAAIEVQRVEALVAQNAAPQAQLDAARAVYQRAQERAQSPSIPVSSASTTPQNRLPTASSTSAGTRTIHVRATSAGNVRVVSVRPNQHVVAGQPVATLAAESR